MSNDSIVTHEHLATIEKYMGQQASSIDKLANAINELVVADKERAVRDEQKDNRIKEIEDFIDKHEKGISLSSWFYRMIDNYVLKIAFPVAMTALIIAMVASKVDLSKLAGG